MSRIIIMRHGRTYANAARIFDTRPPGASLSIQGRVQADAAGTRLAQEGFRLTAIMHSVALRAGQTARLVANSYGFHGEVEEVEGIHEFFGGDFEGSSDPQAHVLYREALAQWMRGNFEASMPGGETALEVIARTTPALERAAEVARQTDGDVLLVSHGAAMRIMGRFASTVPQQIAEHTYVGNGTTIVLHPEGQIGNWRCEQWVGPVQA